MKRRRWIIVGTFALVGIAAGLFFALRDHPIAEKTTASANGQTTVTVVRGDITQSLTVYGTVVPKQDYTFTFNGDQVAEILADAGQRVESDQVLVELDRIHEELSVLQAERALQEAQVEGIPVVIKEKELSYQIALANLEATTLRAPFTGVVTEIHQPTTSSGNWSLTLIDTSELYIEAEVDQLDAPDLGVGLSAKALIEPLPDQTWAVDIVEVGGMAVSRGNSTVVTVRGKLPMADPSILVGYSAEMEIITAQALDVLIVPITCLLENPRGWMVTKVVDGGQTPQSVTIGVMSDQYVEIQSGLEEGDVVLLNSLITPPSQRDNAERQRQWLPPGGGFPGMP